MTDAQRAKLRAGWARRNAAGLPGSRLGIPQTAEARARISAATRERTPRGDQHYAWKGALAGEQQRNRKSPGYKSWRRAVKENAGGVCEACQNNHPGRMHAHHVKGFASHPELRLDVTNGAWLCDDCHREAHAV